MKVQVDARLLWGGGIGRYLREISARWLDRPDLDAIRFFGRADELRPWLAGLGADERASIVEWRDPPYSLAGQVRWPRLAWDLEWRADVTFFPHYDVPLLGYPEPAVVTVHDLTQFEHVDGFPAWKRGAGTMLLRHAIEKAHAVVTVSEASRTALQEFHPAMARRLHVVHNGVSDAFRPLDDAERAGAARDFCDRVPFLLTVAANKPHKNLRFAVEVLSALADRGHHPRLEMAGFEDEAGADLRECAVRLGVSDRVNFLGTVDDARLRVLYSMADALVFPSSHEGFGFPPLEAAACGGRVLAADIPVIRETVGDRACLLPLNDPAPWVNAILDGHPNGHRHPLDRAPFDWRLASDRTWAVLCDAASR